MMAEGGDIKTFNPDKEISKEITLEILIRHRDAMKQARTGYGSTEEKQSANERRFMQVRALNLIISAQREMITISRPIIYFRSMQKWKRKNKKDEDKEKNPFEKDDNEYNKMLNFLEVLKACEKDILEAEKTKCVKDDFIIETEDHNKGTKKYDLTKNFFEMLEELEASYEQIYLLMLINKIVSAGIEEDEEMTYKEKEAEAVRRVVEA